VTHPTAVIQLANSSRNQDKQQQSRQYNVAAAQMCAQAGHSPVTASVPEGVSSTFVAGAAWPRNVSRCRPPACSREAVRGTRQRGMPDSFACRLSS
jgi:hypothetical protein